MANDDIDNGARARWQSQHPETEDMSIDEIRDRAQRFQNRTRNRNVFLYATLVGLSVWFVGSILLFKPVMIVRVALALLAAGALAIVFQLPKRVGSRSLPRDLGLLQSAEFHRRELERERDARLSILSWYIFPVVPGLSVLIVAIALTPDGRGVLPAVILATVFAAVFTVTVMSGQRAARRLQREIDELRTR